MRQASFYPLIQVRWEDAYSEDEWQDVGTVKTDRYSCVTTGYLLRKTAKVLIVAGSLNEAGQACCVMHIPAPWATKIRRLKGGVGVGRTR